MHKFVDKWNELGDNKLQRFPFWREEIGGNHMEHENISTNPMIRTSETVIQDTAKSNGSSQNISPHQPKRKRSPNKWIVVVGIIIVLAAATILAINWYIHLPINQLEKALERNNTSIAVQIYKTSSNDVDFAEKALLKFETYAEEVETNYIEKTMDYESAIDDLNAMSEIVDASERLQRIESIEKSRQTYEKAEKAFSEEKFENAILLYQQVIEIDRGNYEHAQEQITASINAISDAAISEANKALTEKDYVKAYEILTSVEDAYANENVQQLRTQVLSDANAEILAIAQEKITAGDYIGTYQYIKTWPEEMLLDDIVALRENAVSTFIEKSYAEADALAQKGDYTGAINYLNESNRSIPLPNLQEKTDAYQKEIDKITLENYRSQVSVTYDQYDKDYSITLKGNPVIGSNRNIIPSVLLSDYVMFMLACGFHADNWMFMNEVSFDCDGAISTYNLGYSQVKRDVGWGVISEVTVLAQSTNSDSLLYSGFGGIYMYNLGKTIADLRNAQTVNVRFSGSGGNKEVTIPTAHCQEVQMMWEISQVLIRNPDLISVLTN